MSAIAAAPAAYIVHSHGLRHFRELCWSRREAERVAQQLRDAGFTVSTYIEEGPPPTDDDFHASLRTPDGHPANFGEGEAA